MKLNFLHKAYKIVLILSVCTYSFAFKANISDTTSSAKTVPIPLPFLKKPLFEKEPILEKTIADGQKQIKYTDDKNVVDCIFYEILSDKNKYEIGEQVKIKIKIIFYDNLNLSYKDEECQKIALKVVLPKGFSQTGGNYYDFISLSLDKSNQSKELEIIGQFHEINQNQCFILLKGPSKSNWETIFIKKGEKCLDIFNNTSSPKLQLNDERQNVGSSSIKETVANSVAEACTSPTTTPASRCGEGVVTLTASGCSGDGATYTWYNHATAGTELGTSTDGSFTTPSLSSSTTYSVTCSTNTCTVSDRSPISIAVTITPPPSISAGGPITFCERNSVTLTATNCNGSILWSSGQSGTTLTVDVSATYTAVCIESGCPSLSSNSIVVNVIPSPTPTITSNGALTFCDGESVTLTSSSCSNGNTLWSNGQITPTIVVNISGNYTVTCSLDGCTSLQSEITSVTVNSTPAPTITASGPLAFCQGGSVTLTASSCTSGNLLWSTGQTSSEIIVDTSGNYTVTCTQNNCPSLPSAVSTAVVNPLPSNPSISSNTTTICGNGTVTINSSGCLGTVMWSNGMIGSSVTISSIGNYSAVCKNNNDCQSSQSNIIVISTGTVPTAPSISADGNTTFCDGTSRLINASNCNGLVQWSNGFVSSSITVNSAGTYSAVCIVNGCTSTSSNQISTLLLARPSSPVINANGTSNYNSSTGIITIFNYNGQNIKLNAVGCTGTVIWSNGQSGTTINNTLNDNIIFTATCKNANNCISLPSNQITIQRCTNIVPSLTANNTSLTACQTLSLTISGCDASFPNKTISKVNSYPESIFSITSSNIWNSSTTESASYSTYCYNTTNPQCQTKSSNTISIIVTPDIPRPIVPSNSFNVCYGSSVTLSASGCSGTYKWYNEYNQLVSQAGSFDTGPLTYIKSNVTNFRNYNYYVSCNINNCEGLKTRIDVNVYKDIPPTPNITPTGSIQKCIGQTVTLNTSCPDYAYQVVWSENGVVSNTASVGKRYSTNIITSTQTKAYYAYCVGKPSISALDGCFSAPSNYTFINVSTQVPPTSVITASKTVFCQGASDPVILSVANCDGTINWQWTNADLSTGSTNSVGNLTVTGLTQNRTYKAKCTNGCGVSAAFSANLVINYNQLETPVISNSGNSSLCQGESTTLTASSCSGTLTWSTGQIASSISVSTQGTYSATCTTSGGCQSGNSNIITITANSISQTPIISASSTIVCGSVTSTLTSTGCTGTVTWSNGSTGSSISVSTPATYTATCVNGTECISPASNSIIITEGSLPPTPILTTSKTTVCQGSTEPVVLSASNCDGTINWQWTNADLSTGTTTSIGDLSVSDITQTRTYKASCSNICGTSVALSDDLIITVQSLEITSVTSNTPVNAGYALNLNVVAPLGNTYSWSGPDGFTSSVQNPTITSAVISNSGTYTVTVTSVAGCTATGTVAVTVVPDDCHCEADINLPEWQTETISNNAIYFDNSLTNVVENTYLAPTTTIDGTAELNQTITYADGFGRPMQVINRGLSPTGKDIIQPIEYDHFGRNTTNYLPYIGITNGAFQQNALLGNANTYESSAQSLFYADAQFKNDANAFSKTIIENSPLSRVIQQGSVGTNWQPNEVDPSLANSVKMAYKHNSETDIKKFDFNHDTEEWAISTYGANELFVTETKDEKNNKIEEFTNILGQIVCKKVYNTTNNEVLITYNAYDEFGRNRFVLPPMATAELPTNPDLDFFPKGTPEIKDFIFYYDFDARGRLIEKKTPDAEPEEMIYNPFDQLILVRNALQKSKGIWVYTKYDELGRPYVSGTYTDSRDRVNVLADLNASFEANKYGDASFPTSSIVEKSRTYYDEYPTAVITSMMGAETPLTATAPSEFSFYGAQACNTCTINLKGKVTATVEQLEIPTGANLSLIQKTSLLSIQYYDEYGRTIQTRSDNHIGKTEISSVKYDFAGRVLETVKTTGDQATDNYKEWNKNTYDKGQRLKMTVQQLSDKLGGIEKVSKAEPVGRYKYNEIGEMIEKWQGCKQQVITTQTNIKGWLLNINGTANPATLKTKKQFFGMELSYDQADGQITQASWGTVPGFAANAQLPGVRSYAYQYDALKRILSATYNNDADATEDFSLSGMSYDINGNIKTLKRKYKADLVDDLGYNYAIGNRLNTVTDAGVETNVPVGKNPYFKKNNTVGDDYVYDFGGNLIQDKNRKIAITYNYLGLPEKVVYDNTTNIYYVYDASGNKVQKQNAPMPQQGVMVNKTMNYIGNMLFMGNELQQVSTAEGRALPALAPTALVPATSTLTLGYRYEYIQADYFGNARTACRCGEKTNETGEIIPTPAGEDAISLVQENHYDPWGLNLSDIESKLANPLNHYQFNGNSEKGFLPNGDFDYETPFRNYNPALGRFMQVDLLSNEYHGISGYNYAFNNPILLNDPSGLKPTDWFRPQGGGGGLIWRPISDATTEVLGQTWINVGSHFSGFLNGIFQNFNYDGTTSIGEIGMEAAHNSINLVGSVLKGLMVGSIVPRAKYQDNGHRLYDPSAALREYRPWDISHPGTSLGIVKSAVQTTGEVIVSEYVAVKAIAGFTKFTPRFTPIVMEEIAANTSTSLGAGRTGVKQWLQSAGNLERGQLIKDIEGVGFKNVFDEKGMTHFERGGMKIRLDPPQSGTPFNHMHLNYGGNKSAYDVFLNPVKYKIPAAHIPIK